VDMRYVAQFCELNSRLTLHDTRREFGENALIFVVRDAIYGWHTTSEFLWSSTQFPANIRLSDHYGNLEDFFVDRVGVKRLALSAVTQPTVQPQASAGDAQYCALLSRVITAARNATLPTFGMDSTEHLHNASSHNAGASLNGVGSPEKFPLSRLFTTEKIGVAGELYVSQLRNLERINRWTNDWEVFELLSSLKPALPGWSCARIR